MAFDTYLNTLQNIILGLLARRHLDELLVNIVESACQIINTANGFIDLVDEETNMLHPMVATGLYHRYLRMPLKKGEGMSGLVWRSGELLVVNEYDAWEGRLPAFSPGIVQSVVVIPLKLGAQVIGILGLAHDYQSGRTFDLEEVEALDQFATLATLTIDNVRLYQSAIKAAERRTTLYHAAQDISASLDVEEVYAALHRAVAQVMPCEDFIIDFYDESQNEIFAVYLIELGKRINTPPHPPGQGLGGHVVCTGQPVRLNSPEQIKTCGIRFVPYGSGPITSSVLAVPVRAKGKIVGMISTQCYQSGAYTADDQELLEMLAAHAAIAFENARLFTEIHELAATDALTGVFNRRRFFDLALHEFDRSRRYELPLSLLMLDVDHFKIFNDTYGHPLGDRLLCTIARRCKNELRQVDILGRYGGEEFVVMLPETGLAQAQIVAERLRVQIAQAAAVDISNASGEKEPPHSLTVSLGVASNDPSCDNFETLFDRVDQALYAAKQAGRNRVSAYKASRAG
jgi:diguanylate cyclase (GGDEF)-like protein